jgi:hypothetical protein
MVTRYGSFLIRFWAREGDVHRIEVEHVQSGDRARVSSLAAGLAWIEAHLGGPQHESRRDAAEAREVDEEVQGCDETPD